MFNKFFIAIFLVVGVVIINLFYVITLGQHFLKFFERKQGEKTPKWLLLIDGLANLFTKTTPSQKKTKHRRLFLKASSYPPTTTKKRTHLALKVKIPDVAKEINYSLLDNPEKRTRPAPKVNLPDVAGNNSYSSLSSHLSKVPAKTDKTTKTKPEIIKPPDIELRQQYLETLKTVLSLIDDTMEGIEFFRSSTVVYITDGDMQMYHLLSEIRSILIKTSSYILKVDVNPDVKATFLNIHYKFQFYINFLIKGIDNLMDFIYRGDKRLMQEGQMAIKEANKILTEIRKQLKEMDIPEE